MAIIRKRKSIEQAESQVGVADEGDAPAADQSELESFASPVEDESPATEAPQDYESGEPTASEEEGETGARPVRIRVKRRAPRADGSPVSARTEGSPFFSRRFKLEP